MLDEGEKLEYYECELCLKKYLMKDVNYMMDIVKIVFMIFLDTIIMKT